MLVQESFTPGTADATVAMPRTAMLAMLFAGKSPADLMKEGALKIEGNPAALLTLLSSLDPSGPQVPFPIATP